MTPLEQVLRDIIAAEGPLPVDRYMALCLGHPQHGYYMAQQPFGVAGDFITAPEVSQVFGELIGVWCAAAWQAMGSPAAFRLVELGPGRGTLMADILRAARVMPGFADAASVHLVETSPRLRAAQRQAIAGAASWHDGLAEVPDGPTIVVANEFFDAIPIRQFERRDGRWRERAVGLVDGRLTIGLADTDAAAGQDSPGQDGDVIEFAPGRAAIARLIGGRLAAAPGAALVIDYGHLAAAPGDTLQAVRRHRKVPVLDRPGESDLTSHVDFASLAAALAEGGAQAWPGLTQRQFLLAMGLAQRTAALAARVDMRTRTVLQRAMTRLADAAEMGNLFKVLAATSPGLATPYPFGRT